MAKKPKVKLNSEGIQSIMKGQGDARNVRETVAQAAIRISKAAGPGNTVRVRVGRTRVRATVTTSSFAAKRAEAKNKALTRAFDAGRG